MIYSVIYITYSNCNRSRMSKIEVCWFSYSLNVPQIIIALQKHWSGIMVQCWHLMNLLWYFGIWVVDINNVGCSVV